VSVIGTTVRDTKNVYRQLKCLGICLRGNTKTEYIPSEWRLLLLDETKNIPHINTKQIKLNANSSRYLLWHVVILSCLKHHTRCVCSLYYVDCCGAVWQFNNIFKYIVCKYYQNEFLYSNFLIISIYISTNNYYIKFPCNTLSIFWQSSLYSSLYYNPLQLPPIYTEPFLLYC